MSSPVPVDPQRWKRRKYLTVFALVFGLQVALVFALSRYSDAAPRRTAAAPALHWIDNPRGEMLLLEDPLLLVRPHWGQKSAVPPKPPVLESRGNRSEPLWLQAKAEQLGADFAQFAETNSPPVFQTMVMPDAALIFPELPPTVPLVTSSSLRIEGDLARRRLVSRPDLPAWRHTELLTNSVVQVLVDARGRVLSASLLATSRSDPADQCALQIAWTNRFARIDISGPNSVKASQPEPMTGTMIFEWQTLPTNGPASTP